MNDLTVVLPKGVENLQLPDPELITFFNDLERRRFWKDSEIDNYYLELIRKILEWNEEDEKNNLSIEERKPIKLFFSSRHFISNHLYIFMSTKIGPTTGLAVPIESPMKRFLFYFVASLCYHFIPFSIEIIVG